MLGDLITAVSVMRRPSVTIALLLGTATAVPAADRITPTCDPNRVPSCWVEHGESTGPQLVPVPRDVPEPLPSPTFVPPPPGYSYAPPPPPSRLGECPPLPPPPPGYRYAPRPPAPIPDGTPGTVAVCRMPTLVAVPPPPPPPGFRLWFWPR
jgi:hypothetical protein